MDDLSSATIQNRRDWNTSLFGVANCAIFPLTIGNARLEEIAGIPGTSVHCGEGNGFELRPKFVHAELQRRPQVATDIKPKGSNIYASPDSAFITEVPDTSFLSGFQSAESPTMNRSRRPGAKTARMAMPPVPFPSSLERRYVTGGGHICPPGGIEPLHNFLQGARHRLTPAFSNSSAN